MPLIVEDECLLQAGLQSSLPEQSDQAERSTWCGHTHIELLNVRRPQAVFLGNSQIMC